APQRRPRELGLIVGHDGRTVRTDIEGRLDGDEPGLRAVLVANPALSRHKWRTVVALPHMISLPRRMGENFDLRRRPEDLGLSRRPGTPVPENTASAEEGELVGGRTALSLIAVAQDLAAALLGKGHAPEVPHAPRKAMLLLFPPALDLRLVRPRKILVRVHRDVLVAGLICRTTLECLGR